ncbi:unnamed protein product [Ixodes pacificus]
MKFLEHCIFRFFVKISFLPTCRLLTCPNLSIKRKHCYPVVHDILHKEQIIKAKSYPTSKRLHGLCSV